MPAPKNIIPRLSLVQNKKTKIWSVSYTNPKNGLTYRRSTGTRIKVEAQQAAHALAAELTGLKPSSANYKIGELLAAYRASKDVVATTDDLAIKKLTEYFGAFRPEQLGQGAWKAYRRWRTAQPRTHAAAKHSPGTISDSTAVRELNVFRAAIRWAQSSPHWTGIAHVRVEIKDAPQTARTQFLTKEDARRLVDGCVEPHQRLFVLIALATAARHQAILDLRWDRVTWPQGTPEPAYGDREFNTVPVSEAIPGVKWGEIAKDMRIVDFTKSTMKGPIHLDLGADVGRKKKPIAVIHPSNARLYQALRDAYKARTTDYVIEYKKAGVGSKIERVDLSDAYRRAGLKRPKAPQHILKHTAISWMMQEGREVAKIAALTRTSIATIEKVYGHLAPKHFIETIGNLLTID